MAYSLYDATVVMAQSALTSLNGILTESEKHLDSDRILSARLTDDMKPFPFQVLYAAFQAQSLAARLSGGEYAEPEEKDVDSIGKMHIIIEEALRTLHLLERDTVNALGETKMLSRPGAKEAEVFVKLVVGLVYMPNIYFHVSMAYAIMRKEGVALKKRDWSRPFVMEYI
ncbi:hypothetical protein CBS101457_001317 [Exobasidium rhododendri]|nr:hypothetical protein CBS101457_001317 [Exobasidium rhododendri]